MKEGINVSYQYLERLVGEESLKEKCSWSCSHHVCCMLSHYDSLQPYRPEPSRLLCPWDSPGKNTGVDCHTLLQGIFPTQGSDQHFLHLLHWWSGSLPQGNPVHR